MPPGLEENRLIEVCLEFIRHNGKDETAVNWKRKRRNKERILVQGPVV
jgi:hypothetical protein